MNTQSTPPKTNQSPARYLTIYFQGYFMFRMATDPDPSNETRGLSGYTMALATEDDFDQKIRLQFTEDFLNKNLREPAREMGLEEKLRDGVQVYKVTFDGKPWEHRKKLINAKVCLGPFPDDNSSDESELPTFESRNNITGSDDTMAFVVDPFHLQIRKDQTILIKAKDYLNPNPEDREQEIWQILEPEIYGRRLTSDFEKDSQEVEKAINVFDYYGYFYARRRFLERKIEEFQDFQKDPNKLQEKKQQIEKQIQELKDEKKQREKRLQYLTYQLQKLDKDQVPIELEQFKSRLYQLEFWGDRVINKLGFKTSWSFKINEGNRKDCLHVKDESNLLGGTIDTSQPWPVQFWFGGWDGDLLVGYIRGSLSMPFTPNS